MSYLTPLIGKTIQEVLMGSGNYHTIKSKPTDTVPPPQIVDEIVLKMDDYFLNISNPIMFSDKESDINSFIGKTIVDVSENENECRITTTDGNWFSIDLRGESYVGPEAMCLTGPDNLIIVWN